MTMKRFFCIPVLFLLAACANDLGNYDYRDLTEPDITGIEANISVLTHARLSGSKTYFAVCLVSVGLFGPIGDAPLNAAPVIGCNIVTQNIAVFAMMMYDLDTKRFVGYAPNLRSPDVGGYAPLQEMNDLVKLLGEMDNGGRVTGDAFDEFPQGLDFVWMENTKYDPNSTNMGVIYTVLRDGDRYCLYGTQLGELWSVVTVGDCTQALSKAYYGDLSGCTNIARAEHFAFSSLKNYMYYAVGGTVYRVDLSEKPLTATAQFTLVGETITCLKFNIYRQSANLARTYDLVVGSVKDDTGTLRIYEGFNSDGNFRGVAPEVHSGLGRIVDVTYREMLK